MVETIQKSKTTGDMMRKILRRENKRTRKKK